MDPLTKLYWKEKLKNIRIAVVVFVFLGAIVIFWAEPYTPTSEVKGTVVGIFKPENYNPTTTRLVVTLDSGNKVQVTLNQNDIYKKGMRVVLQELTSAVYKRKSYSFVRVEK